MSQSFLKNDESRSRHKRLHAKPSPRSQQNTTKFIGRKSSESGGIDFSNHRVI